MLEVRKEENLFRLRKFYYEQRVPNHELIKAGDGTRTRDQQLGRLWLYQLSYSRVHTIPALSITHPSNNLSTPSRKISVGRGGFEPSKAWAVRFTVWCVWPLRYLPNNSAWAGYRTRTDDLLITNQLLYQLSYASRIASKAIFNPSAISHDYNRSKSRTSRIQVIRPVHRIAEL